MRGLLEGQEVGSEREYGRLRFFSWAALSDGKAQRAGSEHQWMDPQSEAAQAEVLGVQREDAE